MKKSPKAILASAAILASSIAGVNLLPGTSASALCDRQNAPYTAVSFTYYGGENVQSSSTCDGDNHYNGQYIDLKNDGAAVYIKFRMNGVWKSTPTNGSLTKYKGYGYTDDNSYSDTKICNTRKVCGDYSFVNRGF